MSGTEMNTWSTCRGNSGFTFSTVSAGLVFSLQLFSIFFQGLYPARRPENPIHEGKVERRFWDSAAYVDLDPHEWTLSMAEFDKMIDRVVESDILVVGGGGAGASAAIAAARPDAASFTAAAGRLPDRSTIRTRA